MGFKTVIPAPKLMTLEVETKPHVSKFNAVEELTGMVNRAIKVSTKAAYWRVRPEFSLEYHKSELKYVGRAQILFTGLEIGYTKVLPGWEKRKGYG